MSSVVIVAAEAVGNPLYRVMPDHVPALVAAALLPLAAVFVRMRAKAGDAFMAGLLDAYRSRPAEQRLLVWLLATTAAVHVGLCVSGGHTWLVPFFLAQAGLSVVVAHRVVRGRRFRRLAGLVLVGSLFAYAVAAVALEPPDQVGMATKLVELAALGLVVAPARRTRLRRLAATSTVLFSVVAIGVAGWLGAFAATERASGAEGDGHHGPVPSIGMLVAPPLDRPPTKVERAATAAFTRKAVRVLAGLKDVAAAARAGYKVADIRGVDFHADRRSREGESSPFDPLHPRSLVFAETSRGPLLLGAVWEMPSVRDRGPTIGGPLTYWHGHEGVCFGLAPPSLAGLVSPFGGCPALSIGIPRTAEMIHLWVLPGRKPWFGDLDDGPRKRVVEAFERAGA